MAREGVDPMMIQPVRLRLSRARGFDLQAASRAANTLSAVNCARPSPYGNPCARSSPPFLRAPPNCAARLSHAGARCRGRARWTSAIAKKGQGNGAASRLSRPTTRAIADLPALKP